MPVKTLIINKLKAFYRQVLTKPLKISGLALAYLLIWYTLLRLGFFIGNHQFFTDAPAGEIIRAFIYGLVFDLAALLILNGPLLLLYNFPGRPDRWKWARIAILSLFWTVNTGFIALNLADYGYFPATQRRLMFEVYTLIPEILAILPALMADYFYMLLLLAGTGFLFVFFSWRLFKAADKSIEDTPALRNEIICFLVLAILMVPGIKGGFQRKPIRPAHAFFSANRIIGYLTLNSTFTILKSLQQDRVNEYRFMPEIQANQLVEKMVRDQNDQMLDEKYPFLRMKNPDGPPQLKNIVIFIMESWAADYISSVSNAQPPVTPFFDRLAQDGTLYTNILALGHRSVIATPAILSSLTGFYAKSKMGPGYSFVESQSESNSFIGLGNILSRQGYTTSFQHGANTGALGLDAYTRLCGFRHYYGKEDYIKLNGPIQGGVEGVWDEEFFQDMIRRIDKFPSPFCSGMFSLTSHEPFRLPPHRQDLFAQQAADSDLQKALRYADYSLEQFFRTAQTKPWFKDTVFIITADHAAHARANNFYGCYHVPLLIYSPGFVPAKRIDRIGSHLDILPTILDLLRIPATHSSMGSSLLDTSRPHYSVLTDGTMYAIFNDEFVFLNDLEKDIGLFNYRADPSLKRNLQAEHPESSRELKQYLFAYIQSVSGALARNKICRTSDLK